MGMPLLLRGYLYLGELEVFEFELIAHIHSEGQQGDGYLRNHAGIQIFHVGVISTNVNNGADHSSSR